MLFDSPQDLLRILAIGVLTYGVLIAILRVSGKRTLAKLNAFDFVVTVALGSVLAAVMITPDVSLASGAAAFGLLVLLQFAMAFLSVRVGRFQRLLKARPTLVVRDGLLLADEMARQRVTRSEILQVLRQHGIASVEEAAAVVLETDGSLSVLQHSSPERSTSVLADVAGWRST
jgi:uncharacterized membrane protein YcaP (DUF421 family)